MSLPPTTKSNDPNSPAQTNKSSNINPEQNLHETSPTPYRQIRAIFNAETITVYQAYSTTIANAAVSTQLLSSSPAFTYNRMTWIKPSFCWMMYRSGYALKDARQARILALTIRHEDFKTLLHQAVVCRGGKEGALTDAERERDVRVQWDPERGPALERLAYRSIQIGIGRGLSRRFVEEWVVGIRDVTDMAESLRGEVERCKREGEEVDRERLVELGCLPIEEVYDGVLGEELRGVLAMGSRGEGEEEGE